MVFSSSTFLLVFLPLVLLFYYIVPAKLKNYFLLCSSLLFYSWGNPKYIILLLFSIIINFHTALFIEKYKYNIKLKKVSLIIGVAINLLMLFYFKYFVFAVKNVNMLFSLKLTVPNILLPIGISFFTFQGMSYIIDVYREKTSVNRSIADIALYISMFPQLIAGPIVNYKDIADQLHNKTTSAEFFSAGIDRFIIGLSKKIIIADILGTAATRMLAQHALGIDKPTAWLAILCYTFQIYFDFSGYSDMAIGLGKMFGFNFLENFNYPYIATSITDFWRRWHISLSTWFRDYLYIPLGGNRKGNVYLNLLIVFCATGLWHGASWQFLAWGLWHGAFLILEKKLLNFDFYKKIPMAVKWAATAFIVIMGWVIFAANGMTNALGIFKTLFGVSAAKEVEFSFIYFLDRKIAFTLIIAVIGSTPLLKKLGKRLNASKAILTLKRCALLALLAFCIINAVSGTYSPFIYFRF